MNELEINFSKYHDFAGASEYLSHKLSEKQSIYSEGYLASGRKSDAPNESYKRSAEKKTRRENETFGERFSHRNLERDSGINTVPFTGRKSLKREDLN
jgi:hypothetical protein